MPAIATRSEPFNSTSSQVSEDLLAELTRAAYETALRHGIKGNFTDLYLDIWHRLRNVVEERAVSAFDEQPILAEW